MRTLLDTNIIIDVLQSRSPWHEYGQKFFLAIADHRITGCITAKEASDIYYITRKQFSGQSNTDRKARDIIMKLFYLFELLDTSADDCKNALSLENSDYEDAIMITTALREKVDCIVTRNPDHFKGARISVLSPKEFAEKVLGVE